MAYFPSFTDHGLLLELDQAPDFIPKISDCLAPIEDQLRDRLKTKRHVFVHLYRTDQGNKLIKDRTIIFDRNFIDVWAELHRKFNN